MGDLSEQTDLYFGVYPRRFNAPMPQNLGDAFELDIGAQHVVLRRLERAIEMLKKARAAGYANLDWVKRDPDLACVREEPEFQQLFA